MKLFRWMTLSRHAQNGTDVESRRNRALELEREAGRLQSDGKIQRAFDAYDEAGNIFRELGEHLKASICYSAAATCWNIHTGRHSWTQAASRDFLAATEAIKAKQYDYARSLFREAAHLYEREGDTENYSACFLQSQHAGRQRVYEMWAHGQAADSFDASTLLNEKAGFLRRVAYFIRWLLSLLNDAVWGYGEKPFRTLGVLVVVLIGCGLAYSLSGCVATNGEARQLSFWEGLYFSATTLTTVGFGDYLPTQWTRLLAAAEALSGMALVPIFLVGLTRSHLRMYK